VTDSLQSAMCDGDKCNRAIRITTSARDKTQWVRTDRS